MKLKNNLEALGSDRAVLGGITVVFLAAAFACALTQRPWWDEAVYSSPALSLLTRGVMGTPALDPSVGGGRWFPIPGINDYTYWMMPLYPLLQAPWYKIFGFGVLQMRAFSMMWGLVALTAWYFIMRALSNDSKLALLTFALLGIDYFFIQRSSEGRPDIMCAALGFAGLAVYLTIREKHFNLAIIFSHTLIAASCFTHPNGVMPFLSLLFLTVYFDGRRISWYRPLVAAMPYLFGAVCWGLYISKAPQFFRAQFGGNASGRFRGLFSPLSALRAELVERYFGVLGGLAPDLSVAHRFKIIVLIAYIGGLFAAIAVRDIRLKEGHRALLIMTGIYFAMLTFLDSNKSRLYLVHIVPFFAASLALWIRWSWQKRVIPYWVLACCVSALLAVQLAGVVYVIQRDTFGKTYKPAIAFLKKNSEPHASIIGTSELGFDLGFYSNLTDDVRLGYLSGKTPDFIVVDGGYREWFDVYHVTEPETYEFISRRLTGEYHPVYDSSGFTIYARLRNKTAVSSP
jgi:hypothetical protein